MAKEQAVSPLEQKLRDATKISPNRGEDRNAFLTCLAKGLSSLDDGAWDALGDPAQNAANGIINAIREKRDIPPFPDAADAEGSDKSEGPGSEESGDPTDDAEDAPETPKEDPKGKDVKDDTMASKADKKKPAAAAKTKAPAAAKPAKAAAPKKDGKIKAVWDIVFKFPGKSVDEIHEKAKVKMPDITKATVASARGTYLHVAKHLQEKGALKEDLIKTKGE